MSGMPMADEMKALRSEMGLSQAAFVEHVATLGGTLTKGTLAAVETGRRNMGERSLDSLCAVLRLTPERQQRLHHARRLQAALDAEAGTARRLEAVEQRLALVERRLAVIERSGPTALPQELLAADSGNTDAEILELRTRPTGPDDAD